MDSDYYAVEDEGHFCEVCRLPVFVVFTWASSGRGLPGAWPRVRCANGRIARGDLARLNHIATGRTT
jgi:hypothetical protein